MFCNYFVDINKGQSALRATVLRKFGRKFFSELPVSPMAPAKLFAKRPFFTYGAGPLYNVSLWFFINQLKTPYQGT